MNVLTGTVSFPALRGDGPRVGETTIIFPREVVNAAVGLTGYSAGFTAFDDHHVGRMTVAVTSEINGPAVVVRATLGVRDWSGNWDDNYEGAVEFAVLAELRPIGAPPPREDMSIVDAEINQATQFFHSIQHLDAQHVMPDNSIRLIGGKNTGVRLYVDVDPTSPELPVTVSGELHLTAASGAQTTIPAIAPIAPRQAVAIDRGSANHTVNFAIPGIWCHDEITIRAEVFDPADPARRSDAFSRTLRFIDVVPLRVHFVAIHYTGQGLDAAAPSLADVTQTLDWTERVFPTGEVLVSGYEVADYGRDMKVSSFDDRCGDGFNGIIDLVRDRRGGGDELWLGLLPSGAGIDTSIDATGWLVAGCENYGVSASFAGDGVATAHELAHALGRSHAPCDDSGRCDSPADTDSDYPKYGIYPSDSIGEFGFDPLTNTAFDPASTFDFMGYSGANWVSPHTYTGLMGRILATDGLAGDAGPSVPQALIRRRTRDRPQGLATFLRLRIGPNDAVVVGPSFTHEVRSVPVPRRAGEYRLELRSQSGETLYCTGLDTSHSCGCCGARHIRLTIPFNDAAALVVLRDRKELSTTRFEPAPQLNVKFSVDEMLRIYWTGRGEAQTRPWVLLQGLDPSGIWRGVTERTPTAPIVVPVSSIQSRGFSRLRLLTVRRLGTRWVDLNWVPPPAPVPSARIVVAQVAPNVLKAWLAGPAGVGGTLLWASPNGAVIARGHTMDLRGMETHDAITVRVTAATHPVQSTTVRLEFDGTRLVRLQTDEIPMVAAAERTREHGTPPHQH